MWRAPNQRVAASSITAPSNASLFSKCQWIEPGGGLDFFFTAEMLVPANPCSAMNAVAAQTIRHLDSMPRSSRRVGLRAASAKKHSWRGGEGHDAPPPGVLEYRSRLIDLERSIATDSGCQTKPAGAGIRSLATLESGSETQPTRSARTSSSSARFWIGRKSIPTFFTVSNSPSKSTTSSSVQSFLRSCICSVQRLLRRPCARYSRRLLPTPTPSRKRPSGAGDKGSR